MGEIRTSLAIMAGLDPDMVIDWQIQLHVHNNSGACQIMSMSSDNPMEEK